MPIWSPNGFSNVHCNKVLIDMGFRATILDPGLYLKQLDSGQYVYIFVHVDDYGTDA